jgi:hypothetical protein
VVVSVSAISNSGLGSLPAISSVVYITSSAPTVRDVGATFTPLESRGASGFANVTVSWSVGT